jgi:uncharacterized membrane protein
MPKNTLTGFLLGSAAMYFADPDRGRRRRAVARDKVVACWKDLTRQLDKAERDSWNRARGIGANVSSILTRAKLRRADDWVLVERVRTAVGRAVSHPHAIHTRIERPGQVILEGPVLRSERDYLLKRVTAVAGVRQVVDRLDTHDEPGALPSLQGGAPRNGLSEFSQRTWTPALRVAAGVMGGALVGAGLRNRGLTGWAGAIGGAMVLARVIGNKPFRQLAGFEPGQDTAVIEKTIHINAPLEEVYAYWSNFENFPKFMTHLKDVRHLKNGRSHWVAAGPGGISIPWVAETTDQRTNQLLAWRSIPGSMIRTSGRVRFDREPDGRARVQIRMSYCPPAGVVGHSVAWLLGSDPKTEMDTDLMRLKSLLENGRTRGRGKTITREQTPVAAS